MLTNRSTRIRVYETGGSGPIKVIPNATINFSLDCLTFKKMVSLAIRLSPQDPLYEINEIFLALGKVEGKEKEVPIIDNDTDLADDNVPNDIKKLIQTMSPLEPIILNVQVQKPVRVEKVRPKSISRPPKLSRPSYGTEENIRSSAKSPGRKFSQSPGVRRATSRPTTPRSSMRGQPSPHRNKTPKRCNLPTTAPTINMSLDSPQQLKSIASPVDRSNLDVDLNMAEIYHDETLTPQDSQISEPVTIKPSFTFKSVDLVSDMNNEEIVPDEIVYPKDVHEDEEVYASSHRHSNDEEDEDDEAEAGRTWRLVRNKSDAYVEESPDIIQSRKPFQMTEVPSHRLSVVDLVINEDDFNFNHKCSRHSIINEDEFHTPIASPMRSPARSPASSPSQVNADEPMPETALDSNSIAIEAVEPAEKVEETVEAAAESNVQAETQVNELAASETVAAHVDVDSSSDSDDDKPETEEKAVSSKDETVTKTPEKKSVVRRATVSSANKIKSTQRAPEKVPLYSTGKTAAETAHHFDQTMRNYDSSSLKRGVSPHSRRKSAMVSTKTKAKDEESGGLSPLLLKSSKLGPDGRPSTGTMERQWQFMRAHFVNNADDELEWLMVSKHKGAYKYAKRKHNDAEDKYFRALFETELQEQLQKRIMQSPNGIGIVLPKIMTQLNEVHKKYTANANDETCGELFLEIQKGLKNVLNAIDEDKVRDKNVNLGTIFSMKTLYALKTLSAEPVEKAAKAVKKARELQANIPAELKSIAMNINACRKAGDEALEEMEKWSKREKEADEYAAAIRQEEEEWMSKELVANTEALCTMRSYIPVNIADLSANELMEEAKRQGGYLSLDLATEIKNNRLLHWLVQHKEDIAISNFLAGEKKQFFENIEALDLIEIRALMLCLPEKFELDGDGKKNEWRTRIVARAKQMVSQSRGEKVKGGWNGAENKRSQVTLPPLKPDQERRAIYFYRSKEQCDLRLKQYDEKDNTLKKKQAWLESAKKAADEAKKEYDTILNEMRDPDLKAQYGADQFSMAKDIAKQEWADAETKRKNLEKEVKQLEKTIASAPISRTNFYNSMQEIQEYLNGKGFTWDAPDQPPIMIEGVFDPCPEIVRQERQATKFVSAEEEAEQRRREIEELKVKKEASLVASSSVEDLINIPVLDLMVENSEIDAKTAAAANNSTASDPIIAPFSSPVVSRYGSISGRYNEAISQANVAFYSPSAMMSPRKRGSILETANPALLNCLNNMFSPERSRSSIAGTPSTMKTPSQISMRRGSCFSPSTSTKLMDLSEKTEEEKKEMKTTRSKLLQRLLGASTAPAVESGSVKSAPSFLDQLKARTKNPFGSAMAAASEDSSETKSKSFLDELKSKTGGSRAAAPSFLDQLKARSMTSNADSLETAENDENVNSNIPVAPAVPQLKKPALGGNVGLLDAIKARRRDE